MELTQRILELRKSKGLTQADMAERLNTERSNYARLESRGDKITVEQAGQIAKALGIGLEVMLDLGDAGALEAMEEKLEAAKLHLVECYSFFNYFTKILVIGELSKLPPDQVTVEQINEQWLKSISYSIHDQDKIKQLGQDSPLRMALVHFGDIRFNFQSMRDNIWSFLRKILPKDDSRLQQKEH